jgi:hypothetical protein
MKSVYTFTTSSNGGRTAVDDLLMEVSGYPAGIYPVVELQTSSYMHSKREIGRVKVPVFKTVGKVESALFDRVIAQALGRSAPATEMSEPAPVSAIAYTKAAEPVVANDDPFPGYDPADDIPF